MSWRGRGSLADGPPLASGGTGKRLIDRYRPNAEGIGAFERETRGAHWYPRGSESGAWDGERRTEWDVLKENHRFIRDDEEPGEVSWEERLARAYESKLFKEFALIDLKHYKSKRLALRWRTAPEVVDGVGEDTCGSLRCRHHPPRASLPDSNSASGSDDTDRHKVRPRERKRRKKELQLRSFELPFAYEEAGERKEALVKVRLCKRCGRKLVWRPGKEDVEEDSGSAGESRTGKARGGRDHPREERYRDAARGKKSSSDKHENRRHRHQSSSRRDDSRKSDRRDRRESQQRPDRASSRSASPAAHRASSPRTDTRRRIDRAVMFREP